MRRMSLLVCVLLFLVLLIFSACEKADKTSLTITSNGETIQPYYNLLWGEERTDDGWVEADGLPLVGELPYIAAKLPTVSYNDDFAVQFKEGVSYSYMRVYDESFDQLNHIAPFGDTDYLTCLAGLPEGTYYVAISVSEKGDYYLFENRYESSRYDCVFKLKVEQ